MQSMQEERGYKSANQRTCQPAYEMLPQVSRNLEDGGADSKTTGSACLCVSHETLVGSHPDYPVLLSTPDVQSGQDDDAAPESLEDGVVS